MNAKTLVMAGILAAGLTAFGQDADRRPERGAGPPPGGRGFDGPPVRDGFRPEPPPLVRALDADGDGVISEREIDHAAAALRTLDRNNDGELTPDEIRPMRRARGPREQDGAGRARRDGGRNPFNEERPPRQVRPPTDR